MNNLVSVLVPVYNGAKYIERCIGSLLRQTYQYLEIIAVDDGSTDNSLQILYKLKEKDDRLVVVHTSNNGVSFARNTALSKSKGKFILFVDCDDYVEFDYVEQFVNAYRKDNFIYQDFYRDNQVGGGSLQSIQRIGISYSDDWFTSGAIFDNGFLFSKLFIRKLIIHNEIQFEENIKMAEDLLFILDYISVLPLNFEIEKVRGCAYHYVRNITGLSYRHNTSEHDLELFRQLLIRVNKIASIHNLEITPEVYAKIVNPLFQSIKSLCIENYNVIEKYKRIKALKKEYKMYLHYFHPQNRSDSILKKILKISSCIFVIFIGFYVKLYK